MSNKLPILDQVAQLEGEWARDAARVAEVISALQKELADLRKILRAGAPPVVADPVH